MLDFVSVQSTQTKNGVEVYPEFLTVNSDDLMIKGKSFYAVWNDNKQMWSTDEYDIQRLVDNMIYEKSKEYESQHLFVKRKLLINFSSEQWNKWQRYCKSLPDNFHDLDTNVTFSNTPVSKGDFVSKKLSYPLENIPTPAYTELSTTLYDPDELEKIEWAIGAIISGDSKNIQKFLVLYGAPGSGKSTMLNIVQELFEGYCTMFDSKALVSSNNAFALEAFKNNSLVAIDHDNDLSRVEDNTRLNSIVSHEKMLVNEKFKSTYTSKFNSFIFVGTNKPVRITDAKSGIIRRLIDVVPSGRLFPKKKYDILVHQIHFELSGIAYHCLEVYNRLGPNYYNNYVPLSMISATNDFFNFMEDNYDFFDSHPEGVSLNTVWLRYKEYCEDARVQYPYPRRLLKTELMNYFEAFYERKGNERSVYIGFKREKFEYKPLDVNKKEESSNNWLNFDNNVSLLDDILSRCMAQYAKEDGTPSVSWSKCKTLMRDINSQEVHYVRPPSNMIVIDFDLKDDQGNKSMELNIKEASKFPPTYAELSKSGGGIHLHYFYDGDIDELSCIYAPDIEIKVFKGKSALRRRVSKCNSIDVATIKSGLPLKEVKKTISEEVIKSEKGLRDLIKRNLRKEIHNDTTSSINFIYKILEDAYNSGLKYDVTDMRNDIQQFAFNSTHQAERCLKMVSLMKFKSDDPSDAVDDYEEDKPIVFFDVEVFPNLFIIVWKKQGVMANPVVWINPSPSQIEELIKFRLVGYNNRNYDNHIIYARMMGYSNIQLYNLSQLIISEGSGKFGEAYNLSYTDIYDFLSASNKMSLKKWEIKLGIHHKELGFPWDKPVPEDKWQEVGDYCINDVIATEAVWDANQADWMAREILSDLSGLPVNETTNHHTIKIIVGDDKHPQSQFIYTDLSTIFPGYKYSPYGIDKSEYIEGTKIVSGKSIYRGEDPGEGGYVYSEPGIYYNVDVLDVASMHPHSAIKLKIFGEVYTMRFADIVMARIYIKHKRYDEAKKILDGKLAKYLDDDKKAKKLSGALKTAINSVYGLTSAKFDNKLKDPRNIDNIIAKYGALFMINLKHEIQDRGFKVIHIKTDSIKIVNATPEIIQFAMDYAKDYGFTFEHESRYARICLVNDAVYIAQYDTADNCIKQLGYIPEKNAEEGGKWTATGTQFQVPYVFKTLFSREQIQFEDICETKSVTSALYLDFNENLPNDEHNLRFVGKVGLFCPVLKGANGGVLLRECYDKNGNVKYDSANGAKDYRWMESENVDQTNYKDIIDFSYYNKLVDDAKDTINKYGDADEFINLSLDEINYPDEELPFAS